MGVKQWMLLPFLGASEGRPDRRDQHNRADVTGHEQSSQGADNVAKSESKAEFANKSEEDVVQDYNAPISWWVVSTLFPLIAGTFGPMASAFNICAVATDWRLIVDASLDESQGQHVSDPRWLVAVNAVSLAIAIIANLALLGHMTKRVQFNIAAPIVIIGWYISGFIDIALVAAAPKHVPLPDNAMATWSQAYYYAIFSGAIYVLLSMMLSVTACGVWFGQISHSFKLTLAQRSLMLQTMLFLGYVLAAAAVYSRIEGWVYLDAVYMMVVTLFTIGFGDFTPKTHLGRSLFFPTAVGGIIFVGMIIANIRTLVLESGSVKVSTRLVEKARYKAIEAGDPGEGILKIGGIKRRDMNAPTELERREKEFNAMREVQEAAAHNNRLFALLTSATAFTILWFIGGVAFWQAEKAVGGQDWTYFESVYFTYVAQLTIGYGDLEPQTNSSKPAFVFWALIALPTLTVLIGAVGDSVIDAVNYFTLWLPSHAPRLIRVSTTLLKQSGGQQDPKTTVKAEDSTAQDSFDGIANIEKGNLVPAAASHSAFGKLNTEAIEHAYRPFVMLQAAQKILEHLDEEKPRQYTFQEWTWLLRLLGEDEASEDGHRRIGQAVSDGVEIATPIRHDKKSQVWSWMGQESPLMILQDDSEPKWVLKQLLKVLEEDMKSQADGAVGRETGQPIREDK